MTTRLDLTNELLRKEDIEGLLSTGAPHDEYEPEAEMIVYRAGEAESNAPSRKVTRKEVDAIIRFGRKCSLSRKINFVIGVEPFSQLLLDWYRRTSQCRKQKGNEGPRCNQTRGAGRLAAGSNQRQPPPISSSFPGTVTVAGHPSLDIPPGTLNNILKQAGLK